MQVNRCSGTLRLWAAVLTTMVVAAACSIATDEASPIAVRDRSDLLAEDPEPAPADVSGPNDDTANQPEPQQELAGFDLGAVRPGDSGAHTATSTQGAEVDLDFSEPTPTATAVPTATATAAPTTRATATPTATVEPTTDADPTATAEADPTATETATAEPTATAEADPTATAEADPTATAVATATVAPTATTAPTPTVAPTPTIEATPTVEATPTQVATSEGQTLFLSWCAACHGTDGTTIVGDFDTDLSASSLGAIDIVAFSKVGFDSGDASTSMPPFAGSLTDQQLELIAEYVVNEIASPPG